MPRTLAWRSSTKIYELLLALLEVKQHRFFTQSMLLNGSLHKVDEYALGYRHLE